MDKKEISIKEYEQLVADTKIYPNDTGIEYCTLGLTGEAGEVANKVKKWMRDNPMLMFNIKHTSSPLSNNSEINEDVNYAREALGKELGDVLWYVTALAFEIGLSLDDVMRVNMDKLIARKVQGKLMGEGDNRENVSWAGAATLGTSCTSII